MKKDVRVALIQSAPVLFDLKKSLIKVQQKVEEAG